MRALTYPLRSRKRIDKPAHASTNRECPYRPISNSSPQLGRRRHDGRTNRRRGRCSRANPSRDGLARVLYPSIAPLGSAPLAGSYTALHYHSHPPPLLTLEIDPPPPLEQRPARSSCAPPSARSSQPRSPYRLGLTIYEERAAWRCTEPTWEATSPTNVTNSAFQRRRAAPPDRSHTRPRPPPRPPPHRRLPLDPLRRCARGRRQWTASPPTRSSRSPPPPFWALQPPSTALYTPKRANFSARLRFYWRKCSHCMSCKAPCTFFTVAQVHLLPRTPVLGFTH